MKHLVLKRLPEAPLVPAENLKSGDTILIEVNGQTTTAQCWSKKTLENGKVSFLVNIDGSKRLVEWMVPADELVNLFTIEMAKAVIS